MVFSATLITSKSAHLNCISSNNTGNRHKTGHNTYSSLCNAPIFQLPSNAATQSNSMSNSLAFIDIGANLLDLMFKGNYHDKSIHPPDLDSVLQRSFDAGVEKIIITSGNLEEAKAALALARTHERLFTTVGVHPTRCSEFETYPQGPDGYLAALKEVLDDGTRDGKIVAIGECGLDYDRLQFCDPETQKRYFKAQFELAKHANLPMFLHLRAAADDFLDIVHQHIDDFPAGVVHSFDGTASELKNILKFKKLDIGLNGCSLKTEENLSVAKLVPVERLHFETDAPWCDIRPTHAGAAWVKSKLAVKDKKKYEVGCLVKGRNEPCNIRQVFEVVAGIKMNTRDINAAGKEKEKEEEATAAAAEELCRAVYNNSSTIFFPKGK
jgi:TatD DNase family protein